MRGQWNRRFGSRQVGCVCVERRGEGSIWTASQDHGTVYCKNPWFRCSQPLVHSEILSLKSSSLATLVAVPPFSHIMCTTLFISFHLSLCLSLSRFSFILSLLNLFLLIYFNIYLLSFTPHLHIFLSLSLPHFCVSVRVSLSLLIRFPLSSLLHRCNIWENML